MSLILAGTFFGTLGVLSRHELAAYVRQHFTETAASTTKQAAEMSKPSAPPESHAATENTTGIAPRPFPKIPGAPGTPST
jgi:hypothetical protein